MNARAVKMDRMSIQQRMLVEKFVDEIMFEGQMLHRNSVQINVLNTNPTPTQHHLDNIAVPATASIRIFQIFMHLFLKTIDSLFL